MSKSTVDDYVSALKGWQKEVAQKLRLIVREAAPEAEEAIKWGQPVYSFGGPLAYFKAFKNAVNFGFWRGAEMEDPQGVLVGSGEKMRHVKISSVEEVDKEVLTDFIHQGLELNRSKGSPTKRS